MSKSDYSNIGTHNITNGSYNTNTTYYDVWGGYLVNEYGTKIKRFDSAGNTYYLKTWEDTRGVKELPENPVYESSDGVSLENSEESILNAKLENEAIIKNNKEVADLAKLELESRLEEEYMLENRLIRQPMSFNEFRTSLTDIADQSRFYYLPSEKTYIEDMLNKAIIIFYNTKPMYPIEIKQIRNNIIHTLESLLVNDYKHIDQSFLDSALAMGITLNPNNIPDENDTNRDDYLSYWNRHEITGTIRNIKRENESYPFYIFSQNFESVGVGEHKQVITRLHLITGYEHHVIYKFFNHRNNRIVLPSTYYKGSLELITPGAPHIGFTYDSNSVVSLRGKIRKLYLDNDRNFVPETELDPNPYLPNIVPNPTPEPIPLPILNTPAFCVIIGKNRVGTVFNASTEALCDLLAFDDEDRIGYKWIPPHDGMEGFCAQTEHKTTRIECNVNVGRQWIRAHGDTPGFCVRSSLGYMRNYAKTQATCETQVSGNSIVTRPYHKWMQSHTTENEIINEIINTPAVCTWTGKKTEAQCIGAGDEYTWIPPHDGIGGFCRHTGGHDESSCIATDKFNWIEAHGNIPAHCNNNNGKYTQEECESRSDELDWIPEH